MDIAVRSGRARLLALGLAILVALAASGCMPDDARTFLDRANDLRAGSGLPALQEHDTLTAKAERWAEHMAATGRLEHSTLTADLDGLAWTALGENVAVSTPTSDTLRTLHDLLVSSPQHRANLLSGQFTHLGVGVATSRDGRVWVVEVLAGL